MLRSGDRRIESVTFGAEAEVSDGSDGGDARRVGEEL